MDILYNEWPAKSGNITKETWSIVNKLRNIQTSSSTTCSTPERVNSLKMSQNT